MSAIKGVDCKWVGIIAIKTERTQIHFLSDVVAVASLDLKSLISLAQLYDVRHRGGSTREKTILQLWT